MSRQLRSISPTLLVLPAKLFPDPRIFGNKASGALTLLSSTDARSVTFEAMQIGGFFNLVKKFAAFAFHRGQLLFEDDSLSHRTVSAFARVS
ncbi:hypothetical protein AO501_29995 [Mycobacterium gordonae]|uniref:Uncharacterized protein n=1 Tax=Mycobacterium gordonae TaxID=1778 RepID=A0A0Q2LRH6_MYCGO|nr:hypothetical protein AO501_29995 [Mycobacterium gordonae]